MGGSEWRWAAGLWLALVVAGCGEPVTDMEVGICFDDVRSAAVDAAPRVPCQDPHDNEVFAVFEYDDSPTWPGHVEIDDIARDQCIARFEEYVGLPYPASTLEVLPITPTEETWVRDGDREIVCALYNLDLTKLVGSMEGARR
ncbi:MAG: septum formation family protein [Actinomycetota bacterium]